MMQVTNTQAARAFAALRASRRRAGSRRRRGRGRAGRIRPGRAIGISPTTIDCALREIEALPEVRSDRVVAARRRLAAGEHPSADEVADMIVRRSVCDRLR
jgi:hypothetical protein